MVLKQGERLTVQWSEDFGFSVSALVSILSLHRFLQSRLCEMPGKYQSVTDTLQSLDLDRPVLPQTSRCFSIKNSLGVRARSLTLGRLAKISSASGAASEIPVSSGQGSRLGSLSIRQLRIVRSTRSSKHHDFERRFRLPRNSGAGTFLGMAVDGEVTFRTREDITCDPCCLGG